MAETTHCPNCGKETDYSDYYRAKNGRKTYAICKDCVRKRHLKRYHSDESVRNRKKETKANYKLESRQYIAEYIKSHPCVDCGESDPIVLQFDHRDRASKKMAVGQLMSCGYTVKHIIDEIEKCDVVCANCHARRTAKQFNWAKNNEG